MPVYLANEVSLHQTLAPCRHFQCRIGSDSSFPSGSDPPTHDSIRHAKQCIHPPVWNEDSVWDLHRTDTLNRPDPHANYTLVRATLLAEERAAAVRRGRFDSRFALCK